MVVMRPYKRGVWHVDIRLVLLDGMPLRERKVFRAASKSAARRWGENRERHLLQHGPAQKKKEVPRAHDRATRSGVAGASTPTREAVLVQLSGEPLTMKVEQDRVASAARRAGVRPGVHVLRYTFCSHPTMRGAPARATQELAGHQDLTTTQRYM